MKDIFNYTDSIARKIELKQLNIIAQSFDLLDMVLREIQLD